MTRHLQRVIRATAAGLVLLTLLGGVPVLLGLTVGNPLHGASDLLAGDITNTVVIDLVAAVAYLAWAQFALAVAVELVTRACRLPMPRRIPGVFAGQQRMAHALIAAALLTSSTVNSVIVPALGPLVPPVSATQTATRTAASQTVVSQAPLASDVPRHATVSTQPGHRKITIETDGPGTYWDLARVHLGTGERWPEIWALNHGRHQPDGAVMSSPGLLRPGWTVLVPTDDAADPASPHEPSPHESPHDDGERPVTVRPGDTLSGIAAAHHDPHGWTDLWERNHDRREPHGRRFTDPDHIEPGWTIDVPSPEHRDTAPTPAPPEQPEPSPPSPSPSSPASSTTSPTVSVSSTVTSSTETPSPTQSPTQSPTAAPSAAPSPTEAPSPTTSPTTSPESSPTTSPASSVPAPTSETTSPTGRDDQTWPPAALLGAGFGGGLLTGVTLTALTRHRRRQFRYRRPGRAIPATPTDLIPLEKTLLRAGTTGIVDVTWLDEALRSLTHRLAADPTAHLPDVLAVRMHHDDLELVLAQPAPTAPRPWTVDATGLRWTLHRHDDLGYLPEQRPFHLAPYPALVSIGYTTDGQQWLLDLERAAALHLTGDHDRCLNLARFIAAELAHNVWSEQVEIELVGLGAEMADLNPERLHHNPDPHTALTTVRSHLTATRHVLDRLNGDTLTARLHSIDTDMAMPHVLLIADPASTATAPSAPGPADTAAELADLLHDIDADHRRSATAVLALTAPSQTTPLPSSSTSGSVSAAGAGARDGLSAGGAASGGWVLHVDREGIVRIPRLGLELIAQQVPEREAAHLAQLLAAAARIDDRPMPRARGGRAWEAHCDAAGAPSLTVTVSRSSQPGLSGGPGDLPRLHVADPPAGGAPGGASGDVPAGAASVLPEPTGHYVAHAATTSQDVQALAPAVTAAGRRRIEDSDPALDDDLAVWHAPDCPLPTLRLLGPVDVTAHGPLPQTRPRKAWNVEVVAYLACHPRGVTAEQFGTALWPDDPDIARKSKPRQAIYIARKWLGTNPRTGRDHLPAASPSPAGPALYRVHDVLVDADLFRRLRLRGSARGPDGIVDLQAALDLVTGIPFDQRRPTGYMWLVETPLDHEYTAMIVDVAHLGATHYLATGQPALARAAAHVALTAGSRDDIALLDLVAACDAEDNHAEAERYIRQIMSNHDAEVEEDLPPRTAQILHRRWTTQAS